MQMIVIAGVELWGIKDFYSEVFPLLQGDAGVWDFGYVEGMGSRLAACPGFQAAQIARILGVEVVFVGFVDMMQQWAVDRQAAYTLAPVLE